MKIKTLIRTLIAIGVVGIVWPLIGWLALYSQYERQTAAEMSLPTPVFEETAIRLETGRTHLRLFPIPAIELYNARVHVDGLDEPLRLAHATWRARWYSPWVFYWLPERFIIRQGQLLQDAPLADINLQDSIRDGSRYFHKSGAILGEFQALEIERFDLTLFDPDTEYVVDLALAGELRRTVGGVELQSITDISGDGWVDHGFLRLHGRWTPAEDLQAPVLLQSLDAHLEFASLNRAFGLYQWSAEAENLRFNPDTESIRADYLVLGTGRSDGGDSADYREYGERTAINRLVWRGDDTYWQAEDLQRAVALQPHSERVSDVRWLLDSEQWRTGGSNQVGRTQLTWELNLRAQPLDQVRAQIIQAGGRASSLDRWEGDNAEVTISAISDQLTQSMTGWASVTSDLETGQLLITDGEFTESRQAGDTLWLFGDLLVDDDTLTLNDMSGTLRGEPVYRQAGLETWLDCWGDWSPLLIAVITQCTEPLNDD